MPRSSSRSPPTPAPAYSSPQPGWSQLQQAHGQERDNSTVVDFRSGQEYPEGPAAYGIYGSRTPTQKGVRESTALEQQGWWDAVPLSHSRPSSAYPPPQSHGRTPSASLQQRPVYEASHSEKSLPLSTVESYGAQELLCGGGHGHAGKEGLGRKPTTITLATTEASYTSRDPLREPGGGGGRKKLGSTARKEKGPVEVERQSAGWADFWAGLRSRNQIIYLLLVLLQSLSVLLLLALSARQIFIFPSSSSWHLAPVWTYMSIFAFASVFEVVMSVDALRTRNTTQMLALRGFGVAMGVYSGLMGIQIHEFLRADRAGDDCRLGSNADDLQVCAAADEIYAKVDQFIWAIPGLIGAGGLGLGWMTWRLYSEYGWEMYHRIGADIRLQRMYRSYSICVVLLKFMLFFAIGYSLQLVILVGFNSRFETYMTIVALPITFLIVIGGAWAIRKEIAWLAVILFLGEAFGIVYFAYKLYRVFATWKSADFVVPRNTLAVFNVVCLLIVFALTISSIVCRRNFGKGLKEKIPPYLPPTEAQIRRRKSGRNKDSVVPEERMTMD